MNFFYFLITCAGIGATLLGLITFFEGHNSPFSKLVRGVVEWKKLRDEKEYKIKQLEFEHQKYMEKLRLNYYEENK